MCIVGSASCVSSKGEFIDIENLPAIFYSMISLSWKRHGGIVCLYLVHLTTLEFVTRVTEKKQDETGRSILDTRKFD